MKTTAERRATSPARPAQARSQAPPASERSIAPESAAPQDAAAANESKKDR